MTTVEPAFNDKPPSGSVQAPLTAAQRVAAMRERQQNKGFRRMESLVSENRADTIRRHADALGVSQAAASGAMIGFALAFIKREGMEAFLASLGLKEAWKARSLNE